MFPLDTAGIIAADVFKVCPRSWRWFHLDNQIHAKVAKVQSFSLFPHCTKLHTGGESAEDKAKTSVELLGKIRQALYALCPLRLRHCFTVPRQPKQFGSKDCQRERMQDESRWIKMDQDESRWNVDRLDVVPYRFWLLVNSKALHHWHWTWRREISFDRHG